MLTRIKQIAVVIGVFWVMSLFMSNDSGILSRLGIDTSGPKIDAPATLKDGAAIADQWEVNGSRFVLVTEGNMQTKVGPFASEKTAHTLKKSQRVRIVERLDEEEVVDGEIGTWVLLANETGDTALGWVLDHSLGYKSRFQKRETWTLGPFKFCVGDICEFFTVYPNASFINNWKASGDSGIHLEGQSKGHLVEYNGIVLPKSKDNAHRLRFLQLTDDDTLAFEEKYSGHRILIE